MPASVPWRFEDVYESEFGNVFRTAYLITGDRDEARDLAQEAFARAYERWRRVSRLSPPGPGAWLQRVVANLAISTLRRRRRLLRWRTGADSAILSEPAPVSDPEVIRLLAGLPPAQRAAVVLRYCLDLSVDETARILSKRPGTVRSLTAQAVARLRSSYVVQEVEP